MSLTLTLLEPKVGMANSLPFSRIAPGVMRSRRNCCPSACLVGATRSPEIFCPDASLPENVKTGMVLDSSVSLLIPECCGSNLFCLAHRAQPLRAKCCQALGFRRRRSTRHGRSGRTAVRQTSAAVNHFLKLVWITRALQGNFERDLLLEVRCG